MKNIHYMNDKIYSNFASGVLKLLHYSHVCYIKQFSIGYAGHLLGHE